MRYCTKCGTQNPDSSKFCINCGATHEPLAKQVSRQKKSTKRNFNRGVCIAIYGFMCAIGYPVVLGLNLGFDYALPDNVIYITVINFIIGFIGLIMTIYNFKKMSVEKIEEISGVMTQSVCKNCKINVKSGLAVCPKCGRSIE